MEGKVANESSFRIWVNSRKNLRGICRNNIWPGKKAETN